MSQNVWTTKQIKLALGSIIKRLGVNPKSFKIEVEALSITISDFTNSIYLSIYKEESKRIYLSVDCHSGSYYPEKKGFFWQKDQDYDDILEMIKILQTINTSGTTTDEVLMKAFPEILDVEFENTILKRNNNGKKSK